MPPTVVIRIGRILLEQAIPADILKTVRAFARSATGAWRAGSPAAGILRFHWSIPPRDNFRGRLFPTGRQWPLFRLWFPLVIIHTSGLIMPAIVSTNRDPEYYF